MSPSCYPAQLRKRHTFQTASGHTYPYSPRGGSAGSGLVDTRRMRAASAASSGNKPLTRAPLSCTVRAPASKHSITCMGWGRQAICAESEATRAVRGGWHTGWHTDLRVVADGLRAEQRGGSGAQTHVHPPTAARVRHVERRLSTRHLHPSTTAPPECHASVPVCRRPLRDNTILIAFDPARRQHLDDESARKAWHPVAADAVQEPLRGHGTVVTRLARMTLHAAVGTDSVRTLAVRPRASLGYMAGLLA